MNVEHKSYDNYGANEYYPITDHGKKQAQITGEYLKMFGQFDAVYSSPSVTLGHRCIQTANEIIKKIDYDKGIIESDLLLEGRAGIMNGLNPEEISKELQKNEALAKLNNDLENEKNPFKRIKIDEEIGALQVKCYELDPIQQRLDNYRLFLDIIKKADYKRILVVTHGLSLRYFQNILTNTDIYSDTVFLPNEYYSNNKKLVEGGNCAIMLARYIDDSYELVQPINNLHLISY